ncbi:MAG: ELWxxDGT repeat protein, partial [Thermoanaerobaculia bacterium]
TDGTPAGTYAIVPDLATTYDRLSTLASGGGTIWFLKIARGEQHAKLWKSDGTFDGTVAVKELPFTNIREAEVVATTQRVFFASEGKLWTSDGTEAGTVELMSVNLLSPADYPQVLGDRIVFLHFGNGFELWSSDGTPAGTQRLATLSFNVHPALRVLDGVGYFAGQDDVHGLELWTTDGTPAGTKLLADLNPGPAHSSPEGFTKVGNTLYFSAYTDATGRELWAMPLSDARLSIADARAVEGNVLRFVVSLSGTAQQNVTVAYTTANGTATAGDYEAASGTLTFAPGETAKTIDVHLLGDSAGEGNETLFVRLANASGARLARAEAAGIVTDDDQAADVSVQPEFQESGPQLRDGARVANAGPQTATDVEVEITSTPAYFSESCFRCWIPNLAPGASQLSGESQSTISEQVYRSAIVDARQHDPQTANNTAGWTHNMTRTIFMNALYLHPNQTATITAYSDKATPVATSTDPSVIAVPSSLTKNGTIVTFPITALQVGTASIKIDEGFVPLLVTVVANGTQPRYPGALNVQAFPSESIASPLRVIVEPTGRAPLSGAYATGTVIVTANGQELARQTISGSDPIEFFAYFRSLGATTYRIEYSGDANFLPETFENTITITKGTPVLTGGLRFVSDGTYLLNVTASGSPLDPPTGTIAVLHGGIEIARVQLTRAGDRAIAQTTLTNLPDSPTVTVRYLGDALYNEASQDMRTVSRRRAAGK